MEEAKKDQSAPMAIANNQVIVTNGEDICQTALDYLNDGYSVIPLGKGVNSLEPYDMWHQYGVWIAKNEVIERWYLEEGYHNIGIVCGSISHLVVIDFDGDNWQIPYNEFCTAFPKLSKGRTVVTDCGRRQLWVRVKDLPKELTSRVRQCDGAQITLKAKGDYVVAPPSESPMGKFAFENPKVPLLEINLDELNEIITWFQPEGQELLQEEPRVDEEYVEQKALISKRRRPRVTKLDPFKHPTSATSITWKGFVQKKRARFLLKQKMSDSEWTLFDFYTDFAEYQEELRGWCFLSDEETAGHLHWSPSKLKNHKKSLLKKGFIRTQNRGIRGVYIPLYEQLVDVGGTRNESAEGHHKGR